MQSFNSLGVHYNDVLAKATDCEVPALAGSALECRTSPTHIWAQIDFQNRKSDGDIEAGQNDADRWTAIMGLDVSVGNAAIVGASSARSPPDSTSPVEQTDKAAAIIRTVWRVRSGAST